MLFTQLCTCEYVCMCERARVFLYVYVCVRACVYVRVCVCVGLCGRAHARVCICKIILFLPCITQVTPGNGH